MLFVGGGFTLVLAGVFLYVRIVEAGLTRANLMLLSASLVFAGLVVAGVKLALREGSRGKNASAMPRQLVPVAQILGAHRTVCPSCGAAVHIAAGTPMESCPRCGSSLKVAIEEMKRAAWQLHVDTRRNVARNRPPTRFWVALEDMARNFESIPPVDHAWNELPALAHRLGGQIGVHHVTRWMYGYWPESLPPGLLPDRGNFVWGHLKGYPVGVYLTTMPGSRHPAEDAFYRSLLRSFGLAWPGEPRWPRMFILIFVSCYATPASMLCENPDLHFYRTSSGYLSLASIPLAHATVEAIGWCIDRSCAQAVHDGAPPAPFIDAAAGSNIDPTKTDGAGQGGGV